MFGEINFLNISRRTQVHRRNVLFYLCVVTGFRLFIIEKKKGNLYYSPYIVKGCSYFPFLHSNHLSFASRNAHPFYFQVMQHGSTLSTTSRMLNPHTSPSIRNDISLQTYRRFQILVRYRR